MKLALLAPLFLATLSTSVFADTLSDTMMRAGLDAEALAASGVVASEIAGIVEDVQDHLDASASALSTADLNYLSAKSEVGRLTRIVRSGKASAQDIADLATEKQNEANAISARNSALDAIFDAGCNSLSADETTALSTIKGNRHWGTDIEFMIKNRTDQEWLALIEALTDERVSLEEEIAANVTCAALLLSERSDTSVSAAKVSCDTNASAVQASWTSAVSGS